MQTIGSFKLRNNGGFVCKGKIQYLDQNGRMNLTGDAGAIDLGQGEMVDPGKLGVPDGSPMQLYIDIVWGADRTAGTFFLYNAGNNQYAEYDITGTTFDSSVHFDGIKS